MTTPTEALARLQAAAESGELDDFCRRYHIRVLTVFGSAARGELNPRDLDIGVLVEFDAEFDIFAAAAELIGWLHLDNIDLVHLNCGGPVIRERAMGPGSSGLYESEPGALASAQAAAITERMETDSMRRLDVELMAG
jgi:predicted nucleotidyltransferase